MASSRPAALSKWLVKAQKSPDTPPLWGQKTKHSPADQHECPHFRADLTGTTVAVQIIMEDNEVKRRFDRIDTRLGEVDGRFDKVDARFSEVDGRFDKVDARFSKVDARFDKIDTRFGEVETRFDKMEQLILREGERTRHHFDVVAEGLEHRIKLIGEGYEALRADVTELKVGQGRLESGQTHIDVRMLALESRVAGVDSRVAGVEKTQKVVLTEVRGLATKVDRFAPIRDSRRRS